MSNYSVAEAKNGLPRLIDKMLSGEEVIITRHGKPVAELRAPRSATTPADRLKAYERLIAGRDRRPAVNVTSVELLNQLYEEE